MNFIEWLRYIKSLAELKEEIKLTDAAMDQIHLDNKFYAFRMQCVHSFPLIHLERKDFDPYKTNKL